MAFNAIINIAGLVPFAMTFSDALKGGQANAASTTVEIGVGIGGNSGGSPPAVSLWNVNGDHMGQHTPGDNDHVNEGQTATMSIGTDTSGQPEYIYIDTMYSDAICMTYVAVSGSGVSWTWMGDIGWTCGADWYPSTAKFGSGRSASVVLGSRHSVIIKSS